MRSVCTSMTSRITTSTPLSKRCRRSCTNKVRRRRATGHWSWCSVRQGRFTVGSSRPRRCTWSAPLSASIGSPR
ncbi:hypothetical protein PR202_gb15554 [Eleusine coracana subsp. coracana]|uniref:Uncharacterized protein n=1 Tax=Eleusine coracana subsp. coracana TaxID=191504 RepID=A0AAV5EVT7_ELECO|nr:hypothetical protein PR202_gb15554 [Eleusine coracana subsp. coracana]